MAGEQQHTLLDDYDKPKAFSFSSIAASNLLFGYS